jgi:hypothetical protein
MHESHQNVNSIVRWSVIPIFARTGQRTLKVRAELIQTSVWGWEYIGANFTKFKIVPNFLWALTVSDVKLQPDEKIRQIRTNSSNTDKIRQIRTKFVKCRQNSSNTDQIRQIRTKFQVGFQLKSVFRYMLLQLPHTPGYLVKESPSHRQSPQIYPQLSHQHNTLNMEPIRTIIHRITAKFFTRCSSHPNI